MANPNEYTSLFDASGKQPLMTKEKYGATADAIKSTPGASAAIEALAKARANFPTGHNPRTGESLAAAAENEFLNKPENAKHKEALAAVQIKAKEFGVDHNNVMDVGKDLGRAASNRLGNMPAIQGSHGVEPSQQSRAVVELEKTIERAKSSSAPHTSSPKPTAPIPQKPVPATAHAFHDEGHGQPGAMGARHGNQMDAALMSIRRGDGIGTVATEVGKAAMFSIPVVGPLVEGRFAEAAIQLTARLTSPIAVTGVGAVIHAAAETGVRQIAKNAFHADVGDAPYMVELGHKMAVIAQQALQKNPMPPDLMIANTRALRMEAGLLSDIKALAIEINPKITETELASFESRLHDPKFIDDLRNNAAKTNDSRLKTMAEAADQFAKIEQGRVEKLSLYTDKLSAELAVLTKAQSIQPQQTTQIASAKTSEQLKAGANLPDNVKQMADATVAEAKAGASTGSYLPNHATRQQAEAASRA